MTQTNDEGVFLQVHYNNVDQDLLIQQIDALGFDEDVRLQFSEMMFRTDHADADQSFFTLYVPAEDKQRIRQALEECEASFEVSFKDVPVASLTHERADAARDRLVAKGYDVV